MSLRAVIFDLDGVIVDTAKYHYLAWREIAKELNFVFTEEHNEKFKGVSRKRCMEILTELIGVDLDEDTQNQLACKKNEIYVSYIKNLSKDNILPGAYELIKELKTQEIPIAIASASKNTQLIIDKLGIKELFDTVVDGHDTVKAKPDPEVFLLAAKRLGVKSENCVVLEDAIAGIKGAHNAGMTAVGVGAFRILNEADCVTSNLENISLNTLIEVCSSHSKS
jgi:beta-phosphoglucomutase